MKHIKKTIGITFGDKKESYFEKEDKYTGIPIYTKEDLSETEKYLLKKREENDTKI